MNSQRLTTICTYALLTATAVGMLIMPKHLGVRTNMASFAPPDEIVLTGIVRDFRRTHVDFDTLAAGGPGHYAGSVNVLLPSDRKPLFLDGSGFKVTTEWTDIDGRAIAPHLAGVTSSPIQIDSLGLRVSDRIKLEKETFIDAFNSNLGAYGEWGNYGADALVSTNATGAARIEVDSKAMIRGSVFVGPMGAPATVIDNEGTITGARGVLPEEFPIVPVDLPEGLDLGALVPQLDVVAETVLTGDLDEEDDAVPPALYFGRIVVHPTATLRIAGNLLVRCDTGFEMDKGQLVLDPEASLTLYVADGGDIRIKESLVDTDNASTDGVLINAAGSGDLEFSKNAHVSATLNAPQRELKLRDSSQLYGGFIGASLSAQGKAAGVHVDLSNAKAGAMNFACMVREKIDIDDNSIIDGFDSNDGPVGGTNIMPALLMANVYEGDKKKGHVKIKGNSIVTCDILIGPGGPPSAAIEVEGGSTFSGTASSLAAPNTIPMVAPPTMGPSVGDVTWKDETVALTADLHCKKLKLDGNVILNVSGDRVIRCDDKMEVLDNSAVNLLPGATLTVYFKKEFKVKKDSTVNMNTGNPQLVSIRATNGNKGKVEIDERSSVAAWIQGSKSDLHVHDGSELHGSFAGKKAHIKQSTFHVDMAYLNFCVNVNDTDGAAGALDNGGVTSAASFGEWYRDVLGVNQAALHAITLVRDLAGVYEYLDDAFHPIDGELLDDEGETHNNNFTYVIAADFEYLDCGGQFIEFKGGDGAWLYIDHQLAMDLGGTGGSTTQYVQLDRLGLEPDATHKLHLFYAQRRASSSVFRLRTNIELDSDTVFAAVTAMYD